MAPTQKVTITCSAEDLDAKLSKAQKELGLTHDEYGRLTNAQGEFVGGLSQARIRMGDYIDAQGRMRDAQGHFLDGLTATELKLRMYRDELGNVYTAEGELIRQSEDAARAQEELATAGQRGMQSLLDGAEGASQMANNLSLMISVLGGGNEGLTKFGQNVVIAAQTFSQFALAMKTLPKFVQGFKLLTTATQGQTAAQVILNAVSGNWVALVAGGLAAGTMAYKALSASTTEAKTAADSLGAAHVEENLEAQKLLVTLDRLNLKLKDLRTEQAGFVALMDNSETAGIEAANRAFEEHNKKIDEAYKAYSEYASSLGGSASLENDEKFQELLGNWKDLKTEGENKRAAIAAEINKVMSKDLGGRTEMDALKERAAYYEDVISQGILEGEALANAQKALAENLKKQDEAAKKQTDELIRAEGLGDALKKEAEPYVPPQTKEELAARVKEAAEIFGESSDAFRRVKQGYEEQFEQVQAKLQEEEAKAAAKRAAEAQTALETSNFDHYLHQTDEDLDQFNKTIETWRANAEAAGVSTGDLDTAIKNYTDEFNAKRNEKGIADLGLDQYLKEPEQTPLEKYNEVFEKVREAEEKFGLDKERANQILLNAEEEYAESLRKQAEDEQQKKESRLNELGITGLREARKTEEDKLLEQQTKIAQAVEEGLISTREANDLNGDLMRDYLEKTQGKAKEAEDAAQPKEQKTGPNASMTAGSQSLYQALTQQNDPYKSEMKQKMAELGKTQENTYQKIESLEEAVTGYIERLREML